MCDDLDYITKLLGEFQHLPRFPDGRLDFSNSERVPVVTCFVEFDGQLLLLRRSAKVRTYQGKWCTVAGYLDEPRTIVEKALSELEEELGVTGSSVRDYRLGTPYEFEDTDARKSWIVHPVLVRLAEQPRISLDWEHTEFRWIDPDTIGEYETVPMLERSLEAVMQRE